MSSARAAFFRSKIFFQLSVNDLKFPAGDNVIVQTFGDKRINGIVWQWPMSKNFFVVCYFQAEFLAEANVSPAYPAPQKAPTAQKGASTIIPGTVRLKAMAKAESAAEREPKPTAT